jgi:hypothetical protein
MDRREFIEASALITGGAALNRLDRLGDVARRADPPMIGMQVGAVSFVDEGTEHVLDNLQRLASVNTLFVASFTYGRGIGGRQPRGSALPDHGKQEYDDNFHGGQFATPHAQYYRDTSIMPEKAPDHGSYDVLADVIPLAKKRGMRVIPWFEDVIGANVPGFDKAREVTLTGRPSTFACSRNPNTRHFWLGMVEDYLKSYDVDGLMWGSERQGPLGNAIVANHAGVGAGGGIACFCQYCIAAAKEQGINPERAKAGYIELAAWTDSVRGTAQKPGTRPTDGAFVTFWRLLTKYPEIMAWERLWNEALNDTYREMYALSRSIAPNKGIGWHIWHNNSFSPFYRAEEDYTELQKHSDFLKVVAYNLCGGERLAQYVRSVQRSVFADFTPAQVLDLTYGMQQYRDVSLEELAAKGLGPDYVLRETKRAVASAGTKMKIWPGIDVDIPTGAASKKTTPQDVYLSVKAAFEGGAHGVLLSRKYSEMRLDNIGGAGRALRELKLI